MEQIYYSDLYSVYHGAWVHDVQFYVHMHPNKPNIGYGNVVFITVYVHI